MNNHHVLLITSLIMIAPLIYIIFFIEEPDEYMIFLALLLVLNSILSILFWINPKRYSFVHKLDGFFAKLSTLLLIIYVLFIKTLPLYYKAVFLTFVGAFIYSFYKSNEYSSEKWCCDGHIFYHSLTHVFGLSGLSFAFI